jgi:hypothetical protein
MNEPTTEQSPSSTDKPKQVTLFDAIQQYMKQNPLKIIIGTPCYGGLLQNGYFQSTLQLTINFTKLGIPFEVCTIGNESLIPRARNSIVAKFMADEEATHLMFIDADITYPWHSIVKLVLMDKDLSGGCYPKKMINWDKVKHNIIKNNEISEDLLKAKSLDYVFNPVYQVLDGKLTAQVQNGMIKVKDIGTGFMMIKKSVIEIMMYKYEDLQYKNNVAGYHTEKCAEYFYTLFDTEIEPKSRVYLSEDYLFCKRWLECGGDCWLDLSINLNHTGNLDFQGAVSVTIGELDTMNKDFKIMQSQQQQQQQQQQKQTNVNAENTKALETQALE